MLIPCFLGLSHTSHLREHTTLCRHLDYLMEADLRSLNMAPKTQTQAFILLRAYQIAFRDVNTHFPPGPKQGVWRGDHAWLRRRQRDGGVFRSTAKRIMKTNTKPIIIPIHPMNIVTWNHRHINQHRTPYLFVFCSNLIIQDKRYTRRSHPQSQLSYPPTEQRQRDEHPHIRQTEDLPL